MGNQGASRPVLPWAVASLACTYASAFLKWLYGYYHWQIVLAFPRWEPPQHVHEPLFAMFGILHYHGLVFAVGATIFAIACTVHRPRWVGVTVLGLAVLMLFVTVFVVT